MAGDVKANPGKASRGRGWRYLAGRVFFWIGVAATILGLYEGIDHVRETLRKNEEDSTQQKPVIDSKKVIRFGAGDVIPGVLTADLVEIRGGKHPVPKGSIWLANRVTMIDGATLTGSDLTIIANTIEGGRIDVSGTQSTDPKIINGGEVLLAARRIGNVEILARGADGFVGTAGSRGANGRDGRCDGFGGYRGADGGGTGGKGGDGGNGGNGGRIRIVGAISPAPQPSDYHGGVAGIAGSGGPGGQGGRGCTGLGGSQPNQGDGIAGAPGNPGRAGEPGTYDPRTMEYKDLVALVRTSSEPAAARAQILRTLY
jgi:hypothetical protein